MYNWKILSEYNPNKTVVDQLLTSRGFVSRKEKELFLKIPGFNYWFKKLPKELLKSLREARNLVRDSISNNIPIVVHGDYDADGICATAIMTRFLINDLGYKKVFPFIPNRFEHGYGLSDKSIEAAIASVQAGENEKILFITVDSGITSNQEIDKLVKLGHKVIVTDHHQKPEKLPKADTIIWHDKVVGATLAYLLAISLGLKERDLISYACLATITDLQPVLDFNRTIVKEGLDIINNNPPLGFKSLLEVAGKKDEEITTGDLGWIIGPRLNASGRIEDASMALDLLLEDDPEKSLEIAWELNQINAERQDKTLEMFELARELDEDKMPKIIVSHHENYHEGIIGLVASRLSKKYNRPAVVISTTEEVAKGSVRSIDGVNIIEVLREVDHLFTSLGGHPMAAGFSIEKDQISDLEQFLIDFSKENISHEMLKRTLFIDLAIPAQIIDHELMDQLDLLRPFGIGNKKPVFASHNLKVSGVNLVGRDNQHMSLRLFNGENVVKGIYFNYKDYFDESINTGDTIDVAYTLKRNEFNGRVYNDLVLKDIKNSKTD